MDNKEFESVIKLPAAKRYEYFIKKLQTLKSYGAYMMMDGL